MEQININFAKHQVLPEGYKVQWWVIDEDNYNATKWDAFRSAHIHAKTKQL